MIKQYNDVKLVSVEKMDKDLKEKFEKQLENLNWKLGYHKDKIDTINFEIQYVSKILEVKQ